MHGSPGRVGRHGAGHHGERFLRVAGLLTPGVNVDNGATAPSGESNTGRFFGAQAANWVCGGAVSKGGASGLRKSEGRSIGAYSGPSSHVAMQFIVDAVGPGAVPAGSPAVSLDSQLNAGVQYWLLLLGPRNETATLSAL